MATKATSDTNTGDSARAVQSPQEASRRAPDMCNLTCPDPRVGYDEPNCWRSGSVVRRPPITKAEFVNQLRAAAGI